MEPMTDMLNPPLALLAKLGSLVAHVEEGAGPWGHRFDWVAIDGLLNDPDVQVWIAEMRKAALIPEPRTPTRGRGQPLPQA